MKVSIIIPVYFNEDNLKPLYNDLKKEVLDVIDYEYEIVMVDDGSGDKSWNVMKELASIDSRISLYQLSRNFGSHAAILCGLDHCTGDCAVVKAADLQEPSTLVMDMVDEWKKGNNVVIALRDGRNEAKSTVAFANMYYRLVRRTALKNMPQNGFDIYLIDRKVITVLSELDERNSALTGQILWSGFKTGYVHYERKAREIGKSRWTLRKKIRLVLDTLFSFSSVPITIAETVGVLSFIGAAIWAILEVIFKMLGIVTIEGWTLLFIFSLFSFGVTMITLGILGEYIWRTFDASRNRPTYIVENNNSDKEKDNRN